MINEEKIRKRKKSDLEMEYQMYVHELNVMHKTVGFIMNYFKNNFESLEQKILEIKKILDEGDFDQ